MAVPTSFSGTHPFRPQCLAALLDEDYLDEQYGITVDEHLAALVTEIDAGRCPRCTRPFSTDPKVRPAGSRVTRCRCVPVCGRCGGHEAEAGLHSPDDWPSVAPDELDQWHADHMNRAEVGIFTGSTVITDTGASEVRLRPHPGGWAEFGYDDEGDLEELRGR